MEYALLVLDEVVVRRQKLIEHGFGLVIWQGLDYVLVGVLGEEHEGSRGSSMVRGLLCRAIRTG